MILRSSASTESGEEVKVKCYDKAKDFYKAANCQRVSDSLPGVQVTERVPKVPLRNGLPMAVRSLPSPQHRGLRLNPAVEKLNHANDNEVTEGSSYNDGVIAHSGWAQAEESETARIFSVAHVECR